jgi:hypothetical protein
MASTTIAAQPSRRATNSSRRPLCRARAGRQVRAAASDLSVMPELRAFVTISGLSQDDEDSWSALLDELERAHRELGPALSWMDVGRDAEVTMSGDVDDQATLARVAVDAVAEALRAVGLGDRWPAAVAIQPGDDRAGGSRA